jgi:hypothetical protein
MVRSPFITSRDRLTVTLAIDESETEPESDIELPTVLKVSKQLPVSATKLPESDSETEPEDEDEIETYPNPV